MPNARGLFRGLRAFGVVLMVLALAGPVGAAKPVSTGAPRQASERTYEEAARAVGAGFWGDRFGKEQRNHVTLRLDRTRASLAIAVPAGIASAEASTRLQTLADRLGWGDARLYQWVEGGTQMFLLRRRTAQEVQSAGWLRSRVSLNVPLITEWIGSFNTDPTVVAVRTVSQDLGASTPPADASGMHQKESFLFYRAPPAAPLQVHFQLPVRLTVAFAASLLLWMLFPPVAALGLRRYAADQLRLGPDEQTARFERWRGPLCWVTTGGMYVTLSALGRDRLDFIVPALGSNLAPLLLVPLWYWTGAAAGWAWAKGWGGLEPLPPKERWSTAGAVLMMLAVGPGVGLAFMALSRNGGATPIPQLAPLVGGGLLVLMGIWVLATSGPVVVKVMRQVRAQRTSIGDDPESIRTALAEAAAQAAAQAHAPIPSPALTGKLDPQMAGTILRFAEAARTLDPDQQAAITVAATLGSGMIGMHPGRTLLSAVLPASTMLILGGLIMGAMQQGNLAGLITLGVVGGSLAMGGSLFGRFSQRRSEQAEAEADLKVARAMEDPQRLVEALRRLEEATEGPELAKGLSLSSSFARRRKNLERLLSAVVLCLGVGMARPAGAAPPVRSPNPPFLESYQKAAGALDVEFWGDPTRPAKLTHAILRVGTYRTTLTLVVPGPVPEPRLTAWLEETARELPWIDADLRYYTGKERCYVSMSEPTQRRLQPVGLGRRLELDLPRLAARTQELSQTPVVLAVRSRSQGLGFRVKEASGPAIRGDNGGEAYLFYPAAVAGAAPLVLDYGVPARWLVAVVLSFLIWILVPVAAAVALRRNVEHAPGENPGEAARAYTVRTRIFRLVAVGGTWGTLSQLGMDRMEFFYPGSRALWPFLVLIPVWVLSGWGCRWARPRISETILLGRRQDFVMALALDALLLAVGPGAVLTFLANPSASWLSRFGGSFLPGAGLGAASLFILINLALQQFRIARLPPNPDLPQVDESAESIPLALAEMTRRLEEDRSDVTPIPKQLHGSPIEQRILRYREAALSLDPDQVAALRVAQAVGLRDPRMKTGSRQNGMVLLALLVPCFGGLFVVVARQPLSVVLNIALGSMALLWLTGWLIRRRPLQGAFEAQFAADLRVAQNMEQPARLVAAMRFLENFERNDPVLSDPRGRLNEFGRRREHLETALLREPAAPALRAVPDSTTGAEPGG